MRDRLARRGPIALLFVLLAASLLLNTLVGCSSSRFPAPVREADSKMRPATGAKRLPPAPVGYYRIQPGDTLYKIAFERGLDFQALARWNGLADPDQIRAGDLLRLSPPRTTKPRQPRARTTTVSMQRPSPAAGTTAVAIPDAPPGVWIWPAQGLQLTHFDGGLNKGIDIAGRRGEMVRAAAPGRVAYTGAGLRGYGKLIIIRHGSTLLSAYAHNARILVREGQDVALGQIISEMGDTDADRIKLHFEIREFGKPVDPLNYLPSPGLPPV